MLRWMIKTLWGQKTALFSSAGGVAAAFLLVLMIDAAFVGESRQIVAFIKHTSPDVWVMQRGVSNMHMATSFVSDWKTQLVSDLPGVKRVTPILYVNAMLAAGQRNWFAFIVGLKDGESRAGPWAMRAGQPLPGRGEIVIPAVLADVTGVEIGDQVAIADMDFTVSGLSQDTFSMANSVVFVDFSDLEELLAINGSVSYMLVDAQPGQDAAALAARIEKQVDKVTALPQQEFVANDYAMAMMMGVEMITFMSVIGSALAVVIVAFASYTQVARRRHELAVAKALGVRNRAIYAAVIGQTAVIMGVGVALAVLLAGLVSFLMDLWVPMITMAVTVHAIANVAVVAALVAWVVALVPAYMVTRVDPAAAFEV